MTDINPTPSWAAVRRLETNEFATGGANGNMNEQAKSLAARSELLKQYAALPYESKTSGYALNERVQLATGDIVRSTIASNVNNPNENMTGWVKANDASQIFDESGLNQQDWNNGVESIAALRALNPTSKNRVYVKQHTSNLKGCGWFEWDSISIKTDDNGVYIKVGSISTGRWVRQFNVLKTDDFGLNLRSDDVTETLQLMDSLSNEIIVNNGEYLISDFLPSKKYIFEGDAYFLTNTTARSNGVIAQTGLKMIKPKIKHNVSVAPVDGDYGNAIRIGTYRQPNDINVSVYDVEVFEPEIELVNTVNSGQGFEILGNAHDITITRPKIKGKGFGIICHWGGDVGEDGHTSLVTYSYHPHNIKIIDPEFKSTSTSSAGRMQTGLILSACYNVEVTNIESDGLATTLYNFVGDVYNQTAVSRDKNKVCTNVKIDGVAVDNFVAGSTPVQAIGYSATIRTSEGMTIAIDDDQTMQMTMKNIVIKSKDATNTSDLILIAGVKNLDFEAQVVGVEHDGFFARVQANQDCNIRLVGSSKRGFVNRGNHDTTIHVESIYKTKNRVSTERGMTIRSYEFATSAFNAAQNATSLTFSVSSSTLLYKGSLILKNNIPVARVTKTVLFSAGVVNTIQIDNLSEAITTGDTVKVLRANDNCEVTGTIANYYNNVYGTSPVGTKISANLMAGYNGNIMFDGSYLIDVDIDGAEFEKVGLGNSSNSCVDITINPSSVRGLRICSNKFDQKSKNLKASQRIYIETTDHSGVIISENSGTVCTSDIPINIKPSTAAGYKQQAQVFANNFDDINTVVSTAYSGQYVGNSYNGFVRNTVPASGFWRVGDRLLKESAVIGQPSGWVCTAGGSTPTWTPLSNI